jgi:predicted HAD superfamily Cof-like phosphohydrolase/adenylate kinase family enzyme
MNIILEGHDNSGKSTLALFLAKRLRMTIHSSEGPERYPGEMIERLTRYDALDNVIFDRHPCISEPIYSISRGNKCVLPTEVIMDFYSKRKNLFIYCDPLNRGLGGHLRKDPASGKDYDTDDHVNAIVSNYESILHKYRTWAIENAQMVYRVGDDPYDVLLFCLGHMRDGFDPITDVKEFMDKFGQSYEGLPRALPMDLGIFREDFMDEELTEYKKHSRNLRMLLEENADDSEVTHQLAELLDALVDKIYVDIGTALLHGFDLKQAWRRVHFANMQKERVASSRQSTRHSAWDVRKPEGWQPPSHTDLVENHIHKKA